jgi:hypothetical protein
MKLAPLAFDVSLLSEADLAEDDFPDYPWQLGIALQQDGGTALNIRATPEEMDDLFDQYRALRLTLIARGKRRAQEAWERSERARAIEAAFERRPAIADPDAHRRLLLRLQSALERQL